MLNIRNPLSSQSEGPVERAMNSARDTVASKPFIWGAASVGFGAVVGGLYTLWRRGAMDGNFNLDFARKIMPARSRSKQSMRASEMNGANGATSHATSKPKRRTKRARKPRQSANA